MLGTLTLRTVTLAEANIVASHRYSREVEYQDDKTAYMSRLDQAIVDGRSAVGLARINQLVCINWNCKATCISELKEYIREITSGMARQTSYLLHSIWMPPDIR
ncbi:MULTISPECIES: hypothetical protein [unclassified Undibacterium]|uniref:hypothetical protein n=1 Tax=unclassified Undibacterium TaxID=2630295 RepID=UPI002B22AE65|nr:MULTISPECIES: hypothetical protein [unclassified Undibacterium]MEB0230628.1 hypothetical protein [Undibacterium sp. 10I3]MEB0257052.1 hypothetical protein [Undibacterium sp. 5I1]